jgi:tetratricopeptide (TPR) repeat protein
MENLPSSSAPAVASGGVKPVLRDRRGRVYEPAVGPRLKVLLFAIFAGVALLGATGVYLLAIRALEWRQGQVLTNQFTLSMFIVHVVGGVALVLPFLAFGFIHLATARIRPNQLAVRLGILLFIAGIVVCVTGLALIQLAGMPQLATGTAGRIVVYWLHVVVPVLGVVLYVMHRRAGPRIQWKWGYAWGIAVVIFVAAMSAMHSQDPRRWYAQGSPDGEKYFEPSKARTLDGNFIAREALLMDEYCLKCHADIYNNHLHSAHKFSSFNNPAYLFSVLETRKVGYQRDGNPRASRWCAGCHDPVPFFSGAFDEKDFDDPNFNVSQHPTAGAGITCTVCHAIVNVNSRMGNADYTIEEPLHYPFAYSHNPTLQWLNNQVVKAKPEFHKKTFLKPFHRTEEFCSTCHKVSIPMAVNHYKEFLRGQNHSDPYLLSGVSGHGVRSFYYPPVAQTNCNGCHMPLKPSRDFGSRDFDGSGERKVHNHLFVGANTGLPALVNYDGRDEIIRAHSEFLRDKKMRIDLFGLKPGGRIDGKLIAPLRPELPKLEPGSTYLVEVVIRTLGLGHPFTQGTADSNEVWVDFEARSGARVIGRNGAMSNPDDSGAVDEWSHFVNVLMLDRNGNRIDRRNPQDIFTPLYNHQIPPGAGQVVHYRLDVPKDVTGPVTLKVRLRYRKFDEPYMKYVHARTAVPRLPVVDICADEVTLPVAGVAETVAEQKSAIEPAWQRWNDYGIGCFLEGGVDAKKGELRQAKEAFEQMLKLDAKDAIAHAWLNLARVAFDEGRLADAVTALNEAEKVKAPWWTVAWLSGRVNVQNGHLDEAIANFETILAPKSQLSLSERKFDFTKDFVVINDLAGALFRRAQQKIDVPAERDALLIRAIAQYERTLAIDPEDLDAHFGLSQCFTLLGQTVEENPFEPRGPGAQGIVFESRGADDLRALAERFADPSESKATRVQAGWSLVLGVKQLGEQPTTPDKPKLPTFLALIQRCRPIVDQADPELKTAAAQALGTIYQQTHAIYKPDENATSRTIRLYREKHAAANHAAEAIVIYPTDRFR